MSFNRQTCRRLHEDHEATLALWNRFEQTAGARAGSELADLARSCAVALAHEISRHFAFEEEELFPRLAEAGEGDIAELLTEEHVVIRSAAQAFSAALEKQDWQRLRPAGHLVYTPPPAIRVKTRLTHRSSLRQYPERRAAGIAARSSRRVSSRSRRRSAVRVIN